MPRRTRTRKIVRRRSKYTRSKRGGSLFSWIKKKAIPWVTKKAVPWIRKQHLISKAIGPAAGFLTGNPMAGMAAGAIGNYYGQKYGFGKNRRGAKKIKYKRKRRCVRKCRRR